MIVGSARDVVEQCGVPRFLFTAFPLGNPCGLPWDRGMQRAIVGQALDLLETAAQPRTTMPAPFTWKADDPGWRSRYGRVDPAERDRLLAAGRERRERQATASALKKS